MLYFDAGNFDFTALSALNDTITINTYYGGGGGLEDPRPFEPKAIRFVWMSPTEQNIPPFSSPYFATNENMYRGIGFASSDTNRACVTTYSGDAQATTDTGSAWSNTSCIMIIDGAGNIIGKLDISSINSDGFTLIVDQAITNGRDYSIFWEAWGGSDITNVNIGAIAEPAANGNQSYAASGFIASPPKKDQCVMLAGVQTVNATDVVHQQDSGLYIGFASSTSTANNIVLVGNSDDASGTTDTDGYNYTGECLAHIIVGGGATNARATLSAYGTDTFTLNWLGRGLTNRRSIYMAIKGGQWQAGSVTIAGNVANSTTTISGLPYMIRGGLFIGSETIASNANTSRTEDKMSIGRFKTAGSDISLSVPFLQSASFIHDRNNLADSDIVTGRTNGLMEGRFVLFYGNGTTGTETTYQVNQVGANYVQISGALAGGVANEWIGYLVFGDNSRLISAGHPFIT